MGPIDSPEKRLSADNPLSNEVPDESASKNIVAISGDVKQDTLTNLKLSEDFFEETIQCSIEEDDADIKEKIHEVLLKKGINPNDCLYRGYSGNRIKIVKNRGKDTTLKDAQKAEQRNGREGRGVSFEETDNKMLLLTDLTEALDYLSNTYTEKLDGMGAISVYHRAAFTTDGAMSDQEYFIKQGLTFKNGLAGIVKIEFSE